MKWPFTRSGAPERTISALYGAIVAQARAADFYQSYRVPDTVNGRCDMIMLHVFLFFRRMNRNDAGKHRAIGQAVFDRFCQDMDDNLREMGIGDLKVPKQMLKIGEAYYGRANAYEDAIAVPGDRALAAALSSQRLSKRLRNFSGGQSVRALCSHGHRASSDAGCSGDRGRPRLLAGTCCRDRR